MCSSKWRLPTKEELMVACENKVDGFDSINYYWSSDAFEGYFWHSKFNDRYVRLVRDGDNGLKWFKDIEYMNWYEAQDYVKKLNAKGLSNMENSNE